MKKDLKNVLDYHSNNTIFTVWNFKDNMDVKGVFKRICTSVMNLNHSAVANVEDDFKIIKDNMPFGSMSTNEMGTYFIACASTFSTLTQMLGSGFIGDPVGNDGRLLDFSTAKTGAYFLHQRWVCWTIFLYDTRDRTIGILHKYFPNRFSERSWTKTQFLFCFFNI
ncbi:MULTISPECIES: hypothetical protein [Chitinophagaceae]